MKNVEVLSPAGNLEKLKTAIRFGADAVYLGGKSFSLRARAGNFDIEQIAKGIEFAHKSGAKVYVTTNIFARNQDIAPIRDFIKEVSALKPDAFIVSDIGVLSIAKEIAPEIDIHISTQANVTNYLAARQYYRMGASRVVVARELSIDEIKRIKNEVPEMEVEVFVHGAMCMAYSGRCLLSNYLANRNSNKGACAQSCRWKYYLVEEKRPGTYMPIEEDENGTYIMNSKDLCALPILDRILDAGVDSIKIEGRVKSSYYVAVTTSVYKKAVKLIMENRNRFKKELPTLINELKKISHREYTTGFLEKNDEPLQIYKSSSYIRNYQFLATFDGKLWNVKNRFNIGEEVEIFTKDGNTFKGKIKSLKILKGKDTAEVSIVNPNDRVEIEFENRFHIPTWSILRKELI